MTKDLKKVSTKELAEELAGREAVEKIIVGPYESCSMTVGNQVVWDEGGPVMILRVWD